MGIEEIGFSVFISGFLTAVIVYLAGTWALSAKLSHLEGQIIALQDRVNGSKGQQVRAQNDARLEEAMLEVATAVQSGMKPEEALKAAAMKYPDVALRLAKKGLKF